jgi:hypothetical protein
MTNGWNPADIAYITKLSMLYAYAIGWPDMFDRLRFGETSLITEEQQKLLASFSEKELAEMHKHLTFVKKTYVTAPSHTMKSLMVALFNRYESRKAIRKHFITRSRQEEF